MEVITEASDIHLTTQLLSIEHADWLKLRDMFKTRDAKSWQQ